MSAEPSTARAPEPRDNFEARTPPTVRAVYAECWRIWKNNSLFLIAVGVFSGLPTCIYQVFANSRGPGAEVSSFWLAALTGLVLGAAYDFKLLAFSLVVTDALRRRREGKWDHPWQFAREAVKRVRDPALTTLRSQLWEALGFIALIVPGLVLTVRWALATPSSVAEGLSSKAALERSSYLTDGWRWMVAIVFGLSFLPGVAPLFWKGAHGIANMQVAAQVSDLFSQSFFGLLGPVLYFRLRDYKEGPSHEALVEVFR